MENPNRPHSTVGLLVTNDLIFTTKITETARALGFEVRVVGSIDTAIERIRSESPQCILVDLGHASVTPQAIREIVVAAADNPVLAFGSHVDTAKLKTARDAGCAEVMPRSRLSGELPVLLQKYLAIMKDG